jgi:putative PEP-CTERM system histidine kinase
VIALAGAVATIIVDPMSLFFVLTLVAALSSVALALLVFLRGPQSCANYAFSAGMVIFSLEAVLVALGIHATTVDQIRFWHIARLQVGALLPGVWLLFSLSFSRGNYHDFLALWRPILIVTFVLPVGVAMVYSHRLVVMEKDLLTDSYALVLAPAGKSLSVFFLLGMVLILMNLERTFRSSVGTMRWRIKYFILGLASLFVFRLYLTSQAIIYPTIDPRFWQLNTLALLLAIGLISFSLLRSEFVTVDLYPSQTILYRSFTLFLVGVYLLIVGILAKIVSLVGGDAFFSFKAFLVMVALVVLAAGLFSDRIRQSVQAFVNQHLKRPTHDYRRIWSAFSEKTAAIMSETAFSQMVVNWVAEDLQILSASIWLFDNNRDHLLLRGSTSIPNESREHSQLSKELTASIAKQLDGQADPFNLSESKGSWDSIIAQLHPCQFQSAHHQWCLPLRQQGELLGFVILGDRVKDLPFTGEDLHLLKCVGHQVSGHLTNIRLSQKIMEVKEFEAFQTMSAFFVHDLKNTASTLSLLLQNFREHYADPAFRDDAVRAIAKSSRHLQELIHRLNQLRHELKINRAPADLNEVTKNAARCIDQSLSLDVVMDLHPLPQGFLDAEQIHKVITNLILNAVEAVQSKGQIRISTSQHESWLVLSVADNGCGMSREFVNQRLFKPFHTTKQFGLGIGMFHSKLIVDAHQGKIEVESEPGKGSLFRVWLPVNQPGTQT